MRNCGDFARKRERERKRERRRRDLSESARERERERERREREMAGASFEDLVSKDEAWFERKFAWLEAKRNNVDVDVDGNNGEDKKKKKEKEKEEENQKPARAIVRGRDERTYRVAPLSLSDGLAAQKAKELSLEKQKRGGGGGGGGGQYANGAQGSPQLPRPEGFWWQILDSMFRRVDAEDLRVLKNQLKKVKEDPAFKIPPMGKKYCNQWQDEEKIHLDDPGSQALIPTPSTSPVVKNKSKGAGAGGPGAERLGKSGKQRKINLTSVLCPKVDVPDYSELCDVCFDGESQDGNMIVFCDSCNVAVHQVCYGIPVVPEGPWLCNKCKEKERTGIVPKCMLCPVRNGAMKPVNPSRGSGGGGGGRDFVHLFCSQWIPETFIRAEDTAKMEPVQNVHAVSKDRFRLLCSICKQRQGACIQCSHGMCATAFHPLCARATGLLMEVVGYEDSDDIDLKVYCPKHSKRPVKRALEIEPAAATTREPSSSKSTQLENGTGARKAEQGGKALKKEGSPVKGQPSKSSSGKGERGKRKHIDLLGELEPHECRAILRQMTVMFGVEVAEISKDTGVEVSRISAFVHKKSSIKSDELEKLVGWIRKFSDRLLGDAAGDNDTKPKPKEEKASLAPAVAASATTTAGTTTSNNTKSQQQQNAAAVAKIKGRLPTIPKCFRHELSEYTHVYTKLLLESCLESPLLPKGKEEDLAYALACSPESETMGELFMTQHELAKQILVNRKRMKDLLVKVVAQLPEEAKYFDERDEDMRKVNKFIEANKEAKRLLKRERRAEQQKENLAAAEAAVAQSTRNSANSAGRGAPKLLEEDHYFAKPPLNIYTKDPATGQDVIYDKYTIQKTDQDLLCTICGQGHSEEPNQIVFCEMCDLAVHQKCYGIEKIPEGEWLCWPCKEYKLSGAPRKPRWAGGDFTAIDKIKCLCCPVKRGAFKRETRSAGQNGGKPGAWVHVVCAVWNLNIGVCAPVPGASSSSDQEQVDTIGGTKEAIVASQHLACALCNQKGCGALVKCSHGQCTQYFHPLCARAAGYAMTTKEGIKGRLYCGRHGHLAEQQQGITPTKQKKHGGQPVVKKPPPILLEHIQWLESNFTRLKQVRQELERLRLISDVLVKREKTKTSLLRAEKAVSLMRVSHPKAAREMEQKVLLEEKEEEEEKKRRAAAAAAAGTAVAMDEGGGGSYSGGDNNNSNKNGGAGGAGGGTKNLLKRKRSNPVVERERVMTLDQAKATNVKLPPGYLYVPIPQNFSPQQKKS